MDRDEFIRQQLSIAQAALKAAFLMLERADESLPDRCPHQNRIDMSTMGGVSWVCRDCGFEYNEEGGDNT